MNKKSLKYDYNYWNCILDLTYKYTQKDINLWINSKEQKVNSGGGMAVV